MGWGEVKINGGSPLEGPALRRLNAHGSGARATAAALRGHGAPTAFLFFFFGAPLFSPRDFLGLTGLFLWG